MAKKPLSAFGSAYDKARKAGKKVFDFEGKSYSTQSKEEKNRNIRTPGTGYDKPEGPVRYDRSAYGEGEMARARLANEGSKQGTPRFANFYKAPEGTSSFKKGSAMPDAYSPKDTPKKKRGNVTTYGGER